MEVGSSEGYDSIRWMSEADAWEANCVERWLGADRGDGIGPEEWWLLLDLEHDGRRDRAAKVKADGQGWGIRCRKFLKRVKARAERRRARLDPGCRPGYGRYKGWLT